MVIARTSCWNRIQWDWMLASWKCSAIVFLGWPLAAHAQPQAVAKQVVDLKYEVEPGLQGCPASAEFRSILVRELGYDPHRAGAPVGLAIRVRATESGIEGLVDWSVNAGKSGERRFSARGDECAAMMNTLGFAVAVQIQLMADEHTAALRRESEGADASAIEPSGRGGNHAPEGSDRTPVVSLALQRFDVRPAPVSRRAIRTLTLGVGPAVGVGLGPAPVGLGTLFAGIQQGWAGLELGAEASLPATSRQSYGGGFRYELKVGTLAGCAWQGPIAICGVAKVGQMRAQGVGVDVPNTARGLIAEVGPRLGYALGLDEHFVLVGHAEALCSVKAWTVNLNHVGVWTMPRFAAVAGIDLAARFR